MENFCKNQNALNVSHIKPFENVTFVGKIFKNSEIKPFPIYGLQLSTKSVENSNLNTTSPY